MHVKKRLLVVSSGFPRCKNDTGGRGSFVYELSSRLARWFDVHVLTPHSRDSLEHEDMEALRVHRYRYFPFGMERLCDGNGITSQLRAHRSYILQVPPFVCAQLFHMIRTIRAESIDLIHAHWIIPQGVCAWLAGEVTGVPYVVTSHGSDLMGISGPRLLKRAVLLHAARITVVSKDLQALASSIIGGRTKSVDVIPMGIDTALFSPTKAARGIRTAYGIKGPFILFVGRLSPEKNVRGLIEAMPAVLAANPSAKLLVVGDGEERRAAELHAETLGVKKMVVFLGQMPKQDLPSLYAEADVCVVPSHREGLGLAAIESLACGTPVVCGNTPLAAELCQAGVPHSVVNSRDPSDIAEKIKCALRNSPGNRSGMVEFAKENYDWGPVADEYRRTLMEAIGGPA